MKDTQHLLNSLPDAILIVDRLGRLVHVNFLRLKRSWAMSPLNVIRASKPVDFDKFLQCVSDLGLYWLVVNHLSR